MLKSLFLAIAFMSLLSTSAFAATCQQCVSDYKDCYNDARRDRMSCGRQCSDLRDIIRDARHAENLIDDGSLVCGNGSAPVFSFSEGTLDEIKDDYADCKGDCAADFSADRAACQAQRAQCLSTCS